MKTTEILGLLLFLSCLRVCTVFFTVSGGLALVFGREDGGAELDKPGLNDLT